MHSFPFFRPSARTSAVSIVSLLTALFGAAASAHAATYLAGNQTELTAAISAANTDGDATSTITLTSSFSIAAASLPAVTKNLTINIGANTLTASGPARFDVGAGAELTVDGALHVVGTPGFSTGGRVYKDGAGTLNFTGGPSSYTWYLAATQGDVVFKDGAQVTFDSSTGPSETQSGEHSRVTVTGVGTVVTDQGGSYLGSARGATLNIENGAHYNNASALDLAGGANTTGTVNVRGNGALLNGSVRTSRGFGIVNVTAGGQVTSVNTAIGGVANATTGVLLSDLGGSAQLLVSGVGSRWDNSANFTLTRGTLSIVDGGVVSNAGTLRVGSSPSATSASILVSGAGSRLDAAGALFEIGAGAGGAAKSAALTIANGAVVTAATGAGTINLATTAASNGTINIGGASGQAATGAGTLNAGLIQIGAGTGNINFNHTDALYGFNIAISGNGTINQIGSGRTRLTADQLTFAGKSNVYAGILEVNGTLGGTMDVFGGRLQGIGTVGATVNHAGGTIAPGNSIGVLTIAGDYTSNGGALEIESVLGGDGSPADLLLIAGNSLLGLAPTLVSVINVGGMGGVTTDGIRIVDVQGAISDADAFVLNGPAIGGAYRYDLVQHDVATGTDGDWYLRSTGELAPTVPTLENYPVALLGMIDLPTLRQRSGQTATSEYGVMTRIEGAGGHYEASASTAAAAFDSSIFLAQIGVLANLYDSPKGNLTAGLTAQYSSHQASVTSDYGNGSNATEGFGMGASLTWHGSEGTYLDLQGQLVHFSTDLNAAGRSLVRDNGGMGFAIGAEAGHAFALNDTWSLTPQAQLNYASVGFDAFTDSFGSQVSLRNGNSLKGRLGVALDYDSEWQDGEGRTAKTALYGLTNLTYEFLDGATVAVSGTDLTFAGQKFGAELGLGGQIDWAGSAHTLHGEVLGSTSFAGSYAVKGTLGFTSRF